MTGLPPLNVLDRSGEFPLIGVSQYAGCNGNVYQLYWIDGQNGLALKPVRFVGFTTGEKQNELYASMNVRDAVRFVETSAIPKGTLVQRLQ